MGPSCRGDPDGRPSRLVGPAGCRQFIATPAACPTGVVLCLFCPRTGRQPVGTSWPPSRSGHGSRNAGRSRRPRWLRRAGGKPAGRAGHRLQRERAPLPGGHRRLVGGQFRYPKRHGRPPGRLRHWRPGPTARRRGRRPGPLWNHGGKRPVPVVHHWTLHVLLGGRGSETSPLGLLFSGRATPAPRTGGLGPSHREDRRLHTLPQHPGPGLLTRPLGGLRTDRPAVLAGSGPLGGRHVPIRPRGRHLHRRGPSPGHRSTG